MEGGEVREQRLSQGPEGEGLWPDEGGLALPSLRMLWG